jgi:hypothetical protein
MGYDAQRVGIPDIPNMHPREGLPDRFIIGVQPSSCLAEAIPSSVSPSHSSKGTISVAESVAVRLLLVCNG